MVNWLGLHEVRRMHVEIILLETFRIAVSNISLAVTAWSKQQSCCASPPQDDIYINQVFHISFDLQSCRISESRRGSKLGQVLWMLSSTISNHLR